MSGDWLRVMMVFAVSIKISAQNLNTLNGQPAYCRPVIRIRDNKLIIQPPAIGRTQLDAKRQDRLSTVSFILTDVEAEIKTDFVEMVGDLKRLFFGSILNFYDGIQYENTNSHFMKSGRTGTLILQKKDYLKANRKHFLAFDNQLLPSDFEIDVPTPFFYQDGERNFFIQPRGGKRIFDSIKHIETVPYLPYTEMATATKVGISAAVKALSTEGGAAAIKTISYVASGNNGDIGRVALMSKTAASSAILSPVVQSVG